MKTRAKFAALICASLAMAACQPKADESAAAAPAATVPAPSSDPLPALPSAPVDVPGSCVPSKLSQWVGKVDDAASRAAIAKASGVSAIRWLIPGVAVTEDFRPDRLNADIGADGRYAGFKCF